MAAQQQQPQPQQQRARAPALFFSPQQQQQQQQQWWAGPLGGLGAALQGVQHNLQQLASNLPCHAPPQQQAAAPPGSVTMASSPPALAAPAGSGRAGARGAAGQAASAGLAGHHSTAAAAAAVAGAPPAPAGGGRQQRQAQQPQAVTKEELGRATWVFLHTLAAQFPERPTRQQQRDARQLIDSFTRIYPCADCAQHFQEIVRRDPPDFGSGRQFSAWMCRVHNTVNRRLGKPTFNCDLVAARWAPLDCDEANSCDLSVGRPR